MRFNREFNRIKGIISSTYREKTKECELLFDFFQDFCTLADIGYNVLRAEGNGIPYYVSSLTLRNYLEMQTCLLDGAYHTAARSLRWLYELNLVGATACIDASLLDPQYVQGSIDLKEFENLLNRFDNKGGVIGRGKLKKIFATFALPSNDWALLYSELCKYVHLSSVSFDKQLDWPNLQYIPEKFDEAFNLTIRTIDRIFWMESRMYLCFGGGTAEALKWFLGDASVKQNLPMTCLLLTGIN